MLKNDLFCCGVAALYPTKSCHVCFVCVSSPFPSASIYIITSVGKHDSRKLDELMVLINIVPQSPHHYIQPLLSPRADATSVAAGSRRSLGTVAPHKHYYILLRFSSHLPRILPSLSLHFFCLFILSSPPSHSFQSRWRTVESYPHYWPVCMKPCSNPRQFTQAIAFTNHWGGGRGGRGERSGAEALMLSMYLTSVPVSVTLKQKGKNNLHATFIKLGNKQIAVHNKL